MARRNLLDQIDRALQGELEDRIRTLRIAGSSYDEIAIALRPEITVTGETVRVFCIDRSIEVAA